MHRKNWGFDQHVLNFSTEIFTTKVSDNENGFWGLPFYQNCSHCNGGCL